MALKLFDISLLESEEDKINRIINELHDIYTENKKLDCAKDDTFKALKEATNLLGKERIRDLPFYINDCGILALRLVCSLKKMKNKKMRAKNGGIL